MIGQLASLLRSSLDTAATPLVPLEHELKIVTDYLGIERVRFGDRLRYDIEVDGGLEGVAVPRLSLQTLVENSVKYAVSPSRSGAMIQVRARREHDGFVSRWKTTARASSRHQSRRGMVSRCFENVCV